MVRTAVSRVAHHNKSARTLAAHSATAQISGAPVSPACSQVVGWLKSTEDVPRKRQRPGQPQFPIALRKDVALAITDGRNLTQQGEGLGGSENALHRLLGSPSTRPTGTQPATPSTSCRPMTCFDSPNAFMHDVSPLGTQTGHMRHRGAQTRQWTQTIMPQLIRPFLHWRQGLRTSDEARPACTCRSVTELEVLLASWNGTCHASIDITFSLTRCRHYAVIRPRSCLPFSLSVPPSR